jgi:hypothetical protein
MKPFLFTIALIVSSHSFSQYYYNDIVANQQSNKQYQLLKDNKVKRIKVNSYDGNNQPSEGFSLEQEFTPDYKKLTTLSTTGSGAVSVLTTYYESDKVKSIHENARGVETQTDYTYDEKGRIRIIKSATTDTSVQSTSTETHIWSYNDNNQPQLMLNIKNNRDTTHFDMIPDEYGNIGEERWKRKGTPFETYYYYYNAKSQLTDIVRFNKRAQKLLPDFLFEYDTLGRIKQMIQVPAVSSNYMIWKYIFNDKGLKQEELCTDRQKQLVGKIEYIYQ